MIILGVDPGVATTGYGLIEKKGSKLGYVECGTIQTPSQTSLSKRLHLLSKELSFLIERFSPAEMAVEELFFNSNTKTALTVGHARGVILLAGESQHLPVYSYTPLQVKTAVCGYGRCEKKQVQYMVKMLLNLPQIPRSDDAADALATAICHSHSIKLKSLS